MIARVDATIAENYVTFIDHSVDADDRTKVSALGWIEHLQKDLTKNFRRVTKLRNRRMLQEISKDQ